MTVRGRRRSAWWRNGVASFAVACVTVPVAATPIASGGHAAAPEARTQTFADAENDQTGRAPDITSVVVSTDSSGRIFFTVAINNYSSLAPRVSFVTLVDADRDRATGLSRGAQGADYAVNAGFYETGKYAAAVGRWNGVNFDFARPPSYSASFEARGAGGVLRLEINAKDLGGTKAFTFTVAGYWFVSDPQVYEGDDAPHPDAPALVELAGMASADADKDGVGDARDRCPRVRALFDTNRNGCTGPFGRMRPDLKFRALGYASHVTIVSARIEDLPPAATVEVRCRSACAVRQRQASRASVLVLTPLQGQELKRGSVLEIRAFKPGWIGYVARIDIGGSPLTARTTEQCLPATGARVATPCGRVELGS